MVLFLMFASSLGICAQDKPAEKKISFHSYGDSVPIALGEAARALGLSLDLADAAQLEDQPCWFALESPDRAEVLSGLSWATGLTLRIDDEKKKLLATATGSSGEFAKGYDVSVISSRYKQYVNKYGKRKAPGIAGSTQTPAERLAEFIAKDASSLDEGNDATVIAVGQRLIAHGNAAVHARVQAWLKLIGSEADAMSEQARGNTLCMPRLRERVNLDSYENRPVGSVVASICKLGRLSFAVEASLAREFSETHRSRSEETTELPMDLLMSEAVDGKFSVGFGAFGVRISRQSRGAHIGGWWMVDCSKLLDRLAQEYRAQQTDAGREGGFEGDLVAKGGIDVVIEALNKIQDGFVVHNYGARLLIYTTPDGFARAKAILVEMGFEEPKDE